MNEIDDHMALAILDQRLSISISKFEYWKPKDRPNLLSLNHQKLVNKDIIINKCGMFFPMVLLFVLCLNVNTFRLYCFPFFGSPVKHTNFIISNFVSSTSTKQNYLIIYRVIMQGTVRTLFWFLSWSLNHFPFHWFCIEAPDIIHINWIYFRQSIPA